MVARRVQISLDDELLAEVDRQSDTRKLGRSAVIRNALRLYLDLRRQPTRDEIYDLVYAGRPDDPAAEYRDLTGSAPPR